MKLNKEQASFKDIMEASIEESIEESYANYGGTNSLGSVQGSSKNKYSPATVLKAPPVRFRNPDISMGQSDQEMQAPPNLIYPFESIFAELVDLYVKIEHIYGTLDIAREMPTLSDAKQKSVKDSAEELNRIKERLHWVIGNIEEVTV